MTTASRKRISRLAAGFTLIELLVVIGLITVLIAISVPIYSKVRNAAKTAATQAFVSQLSRAIDTYHGDFRAYPGPIPNDLIYVNTGVRLPLVDVDTKTPSTFDTTVTGDEFKKYITMSENLVLGLLGGLKLDTTVTPNAVVYNASLVGNGPMSLNFASPKHYTAYTDATNLSWRTESDKQTGQYKDDGGAAKDTAIPEFVDNYADPMPVLYLRAKVGASDTTSPPATEHNTIITYNKTDPNTPAADLRPAQYDLHQIIGYTGEKIGVGRKQPTHNLQADDLKPEDAASLKNAYYYFRNNSLSSPSIIDENNKTQTRNDVPFQKDGYILISAGPDRIYGTADDITNFGTVGQ